MGVVEAGQPAPEFSLATARGRRRSRARTSRAHDASSSSTRSRSRRSAPTSWRSTTRCWRTSRPRARRSTASPATRRTRRRRSSEQLGVAIEQLSDFEPKGAACRGVRRPAPGRLPAARARADRPRRRRALELRGARSPGDLPGANLIFDALLTAEPRLRSAAAASARDDHVRGPEGARWSSSTATTSARSARRSTLRLRAAGRAHVLPALPGPLRHPRAQPAACAAEAAARQDAFWPMHDALFADQGRLEDPHLWARAERSGSTSRASTPTAARPAVPARVRRAFRAGIRAGVATTPTAFLDGVLHPGRAGRPRCGRVCIVRTDRTDDGTLRDGIDRKRTGAYCPR